MCIESELSIRMAYQDMIAVDTCVLTILLFDFFQICGVISIGQTIENLLNNATAGSENRCISDQRVLQRSFKAANVKGKFTVSAPSVRVYGRIGICYKNGSL